MRSISRLIVLEDKVRCAFNEWIVLAFDSLFRIFASAGSAYSNK